MSDRFDVYGDPDDDDVYQLCGSCMTLKKDVFWRDGRRLCDVCAR